MESGSIPSTQPILIRENPGWLRVWWNVYIPQRLQKWCLAVFVPNSYRPKASFLNSIFKFAGEIGSVLIKAPLRLQIKNYGKLPFEFPYLKM